MEPLFQITITSHVKIFPLYAYRLKKTIFPKSHTKQQKIDGKTVQNISLFKNDRRFI